MKQLSILQTYYTINLLKEIKWVYNLYTLEHTQGFCLSIEQNRTQDGGKNKRQFFFFFFSFVFSRVSLWDFEFWEEQTKWKLVCYGIIPCVHIIAKACVFKAKVLKFCSCYLTIFYILIIPHIFTLSLNTLIINIHTILP